MCAVIHCTLAMAIRLGGERCETLALSFGPLLVVPPNSIFLNCTDGPSMYWPLDPDLLAEIASATRP